MTPKHRKTRIPSYLKQFRCIGSPCEDNCCIGWDVDFDKSSYEKYRRVKDGELATLFRTCVSRNPDSFSDAVDYATVRLKEGKVCPFLNDRHLCRIQLAHGEPWLSNVCATYPRYTNIIDDVYEHSATVSCPEAARLILMNPEGVTFQEASEPASARFIQTYRADTRMKSQPFRVRHLLALRGFSIEVVQDRRLPLEERLLKLGRFFDALRAADSGKKPVDIQVMIAAFKKQPDAEPRVAGKSGSPGGYTGQLALLKELTATLNVFTEIDSQRYIAFSKEFLQGLRPAGPQNTKAEAARVAEGCRMVYEPFATQHGYLIENYLVNFMFKDLFPAAEGDDAFDAYMMLVIRYALIKLHLIGIGLNRNGLTVEAAVGFIQAFSKTVEHHKTYLENIAVHMAKKRYNTLAHMAALLQD